MPNYIKLGNLRIEIPEPAPVDPGDGGNNGGGGGGSSSLLTGLLAFYNLSDLTDASGNGNNLTNSGGVTFSTGKIGNAASYFAGSHLLLENFSGLNGLSSWAATFWVKVSSEIGGFGSHIWIGNPLNEGSIVLALNIDENPTNNLLRASQLSYGGFDFTYDQWHFWAVSCDSGSVSFYKDAQLISTLQGSAAALSGPLSISVGQDLRWGDQPPGSADAFGIWSRALTSAEVTELYNAGTGKEHPFA